MSDFDFSNAFEVHEFEYNGKTIYLRECPAGEFITNRTDVLLPGKKGEEREVDVDKAQKVRYENAAKSVCDSTGAPVFKSAAEAKDGLPAKLFAFIVEKMDEINNVVDEGNSKG